MKKNIVATVLAKENSELGAISYFWTMTLNVLVTLLQSLTYKDVFKLTSCPLLLYFYRKLFYSDINKDKIWSVEINLDIAVFLCFYQTDIV